MAHPHGMPTWHAHAVAKVEYLFHGETHS